MTSRFLLTPVLAHKLEGRGMHLICHAPKCLHEDLGPDAELLKYQINISNEEITNETAFRRRIMVAGYGECDRCHSKTPIPEFEHDPKTRKGIPKCKVCGNRCKVVYIQEVVSKHRKTSKYYFHAECFDAMFFGESGEGSDKLEYRKKYKMRYAGAHGNGCVIYLPFDPRKGICQCCGKSKHRIMPDGKPEIKSTQIHHWRYAFQPETVKKNPILILENTSELCFPCHQVADGLRSITKMSTERTVGVIMLMPKELKERITRICVMYQEAMKRG